MKAKIVLTLCVLVTSIACGGGSSGGGSERLGVQIDQMGRAAINTATIMTFAPDDIRNAGLDEYNRTSDANRANFRQTMAQQLAIYDSLVGVCGDNPVTNRASANPADGLAVGAGRYDFMAAVLADDFLYVNSNSGGAEGGQCNQYLAVELTVVGATGVENDCGGRTLNFDTIEATYSLVAIGQVTGVDDGIASARADAQGSDTVFPFLAPPQ